MNTKQKAAVSAVVGAFRASLTLVSALASLKGDAKSLSFRMEAATMVAADANKYYGLVNGKRMVAYKGQRDIAFGVPRTGDKGEIIEGKFDRTKECDATRKWFSRNVVGKKAKANGKGKAKGVWGQIVKDMTAIRDLKAKLDDAQKKAFHKALTALIKRFK
jgi:hypothetical protein